MERVWHVHNMVIEIGTTEISGYFPYIYMNFEQSAHIEYFILCKVFCLMETLETANFKDILITP